MVIEYDKEHGAEPSSQLDATLRSQIARSFPSTYWRWELALDAIPAGTVEAELSKRLPHIAPESWIERFSLGGVYLAGRPAMLGQRVSPPCRLEYYDPKLPLDRVAESYPALSTESILYRDDDLAVVLKPAGLPTTAPRDQNRYHVKGRLEGLVGQPVHLPSRLDTGVAGLLLASFSSRMNRHLQRAYDARRVEKYYVCEVAGWPIWDEQICRVPIERDPRHPVLRRCAAGAGQGVPAVTRLKCLQRYEVDGHRRALLRAEPETGRTHQIRLHCQNEGFPIVGDPYYSNAEDGQDLRLVSYALRFFHPYRAELMAWEFPKACWPEWLMRVTSSEILC
jgi:23S rRNA-/tRNA-specific pseudouridylate synthase